LPGYFWITFNAIAPSYSETIAFDISVGHDTRRTARICSAEFELWLVNDRSRGLGEFLARLDPDIRGYVTETGAQLVAQFREKQESRCRLLWHYTPEQLQKVEDARAGGKALFHLYARFSVQSIWPSPKEEPTEIHEFEAPSGKSGGWPLLIEIAESDWIGLLAEVGFRHPVTDRVPWPALPPALSRSQGHLDDAWDYYRRNRPAEALASCHKAFECLGFDLTGKEIGRKDVLDLLMGGAEREKQEAVLAILRNLQGFFHLGRHDKHAPVRLTQHDAQLAVVCAATLLAYLAPRGSRDQALLVNARLRRKIQVVRKARVGKVAFPKAVAALEN